MNDLVISKNEKIINSKKRVQNHGEVFTPKRIVNKMLDLPKVREACQTLTSTFLEPAAGEGIFLVEVLKRKIRIVIKNYSDDISMFENYSLLALTTLYGIELLEDNAQKCVMNLYQVYYEAYRQQTVKYGVKTKNRVLESAKLIISNNIKLGNFLTKLSPNDNLIVFSAWEPINFKEKVKTIKIQRTEYTLKDILEGKKNEGGMAIDNSIRNEQLDLFGLFDNDEECETYFKPKKYIPVKIVDVYKEEMEVPDE